MICVFGLTLWKVGNITWVLLPYFEIFFEFNEFWFLFDFFLIMYLLIWIILYDLLRLNYFVIILVLFIVIWSVFLEFFNCICLVVLGLSNLPSHSRLMGLFHLGFSCVAWIGICYLGGKSLLNRWIIFHRNYRYFHLFFVRSSALVSMNPKLQHYNYIKICTFLSVVIS